MEEAEVIQWRLWPEINPPAGTYGTDFMSGNYNTVWVNKILEFASKRLIASHTRHGKLHT